MNLDYSPKPELSNRRVAADARSLDPLTVFACLWAGAAILHQATYVVADVETKRHGVRANRKRALVRREEVVSVSALDDVVA